MATKKTKKAVAKKATSKKASAKKAPVKKAVVKKAPAKKSAVKKATKPATKSAVTKATKPAKASVNKELNAILKTIEKAKKAKETSVVAYTTTKEDHTGATSGGFGFQDLKPNLQNAYKYLMCNFKGFKTNLVSMSDKSVQWIVEL
jgi:primosomal protein N'